MKTLRLWRVSAHLPWWSIWLNAHQGSQHSALWLRKFALKLRRVHLCGALIGRHATQITKFPMQYLLPWIGQPAHLLHGGPNVPSLCGRQSLPCLHALHRPLALRWRHRIQLAQTIGKPPLLLGRQAAKSRLILQRALLRLRRHRLVLLEPLWQVLRPLLHVDAALAHPTCTRIASPAAITCPVRLRPHRAGEKYHRNRQPAEQKISSCADPHTPRLHWRRARHGGALGATSAAIWGTYHGQISKLIRHVAAGRLRGTCIRILKRGELLQRLRV